jgi:hypothetical protein
LVQRLVMQQVRLPTMAAAVLTPVPAIVHAAALTLEIVVPGQLLIAITACATAAKQFAAADHVTVLRGQAHVVL